MVESIQPIWAEIAIWVYILFFNSIALALFLNAIDDFFVDCVYTLRRVYRALVVFPRFGRACAHSMRDYRKPQKAFAICVPAWDESAVIAQMLERAVRDLRYDNYRIFVGVYRNDLATRQAIEGLQKRNGDCAHRVCVVDHDAIGPTCKADCLNAIYRYINEIDDWARKANVRGIILHDAEDILHPSELVVFNHLIDRADIIQLPVTPLPRPVFDLVGGHYLDEFSESHTKDMVVREALGCPLPSAGVGCAFSSEGLQTLAMVRENGPFDTRSMTEDYDIAFDLTGHGFNSIFVRLPSKRGERSYVATQEYFPNSFRDAVKQKGRWLLGIVLESWHHRGWQGHWAQRYMLWRDRKALLTSMAAMAAYVLLALFGIWWVTSPQEARTAGMARLVPEGSLIWWILAANLFFLINRVLHRFAFVYRSYGLAQALVSPLRIVVGNVVNFAAALRAARLFSQARRSGAKQTWHKTRHQIPLPSTALKLPGSR